MPAILVSDIDNLVRAFGRADRAVRDDLKDALKEAAAPVRTDAQSLAGTTIRRLPVGAPWTRMRIGIGRQTMVYVAPVERGAKGRGNQRRRRPNLKNLLLDRAMEPALDRNTGQVERRVEQMLNEVADVWERS